MKEKRISPTTFAHFYRGALVLYNLVMWRSITLVTVAELHALIGHRRAASPSPRRAHGWGAAS